MASIFGYSKMWLIFAVCFVLFTDIIDSICPSDQWLERGDSCYFLSHFSLNFHEAKNTCQELGGYLVHVRNAEENQFLQELCTSYEIVPCKQGWEIWLGLYRDTPCDGCSLNERRMKWYWVDLHKPLVWANWLDRSFGFSEPTGSEQCSRIWVDGGNWGSKDCSSRLTFVCETDSYTPTSTTTTTTTSTTSLKTTTGISTTAYDNESATNDSITASSTIQYYPQYGEDIQSDSAKTAGFIIGCLFGLAILGFIIGFFAWRYRKTWYKQTLGQGVYFQPMDVERNGSGPCVAMDAEEGAIGYDPHYEDEALNVYETIPLEAMKENRANAEKTKGRSPRDELPDEPLDQAAPTRRHSNEYVIAEDMYAAVL